MIRSLLLLSIAWLIVPRLRAQTFPRWLAIGDSITLHGPAESLQWLGEPRGMAASEPAKDYVHVLEARLKGRDKKNATDVKVIGRMGKLSGGTIEQMSGVFGEIRAWNADLVTVQLGENDRFSEVGAEGFERLYRQLIDAIESAEKKPTIVCTGVWEPFQPLDPENPTHYQRGSEPAAKDAIIAKICQEKGLKFVSMAEAAAQRQNSGTGQTDGVRWHPNDAGMQAYADGLFSALYPGSTDRP